MQPTKYLGILTAIAVFLSIFGYWARITHQAYADKMFTTGMWMLAPCAALYAYFKFRSLGNKN